MRDFFQALKILIAIAIGGFLAYIPLYGAYAIWSWCMLQIPAAVAWAGLAKIGITIILFFAGASITIGLAIIGFTLGALLTGFLLRIK